MLYYDVCAVYAALRSALCLVSWWLWADVVLYATLSNCIPIPYCGYSFPVLSNSE